MDAEGTVSISELGWLRWVAKFAEVGKKAIREALYEEWPLLMRKVMDFTPPFKTRGAPGASDLSVGRKATAFDIYKTMRPFDPATFKRPGLEKIVREQKVSVFNEIAKNFKAGPAYGSTAVFFDRNIHTRERDARGRVHGKDRKVVVLGDGAKLLNRYVKDEQNIVGYAKSGWLKGLLLVGGEAPGYVAKQGTSGGDVIDNHADENEPHIIAINRTPWAVRKDEGERILADASASRMQSLMTKVSRAIQVADQAGKAA